MASDNSLSVPRYQRSYSWTDKQIIDLLKDITESIKGNVNEYFLGSIVIADNQNVKREVVDGQQRLATVTIILAAIRDYFFKKNDLDRSADITNAYLESRDIRTQEKIPRLNLNDVDHNFFVKRILSLPGSSDRNVSTSRDSHKRIVQAAYLVEEHIKTIISTTNKTTDFLIDWIEFFSVKAKVICVSVPDNANAFTIFETLNDRGLELAVSDLLKNYLFSVAQNRIEEVQQKWLSMVGTLESVASEEVVVTYIRQLWTSRDGPTREKELYDKIKASITSKQHAVDFADDLQSNARFYAAILSPSSEVLNQYGSTVREDITNLNVLSFQQMRPLILSILDKFDIVETQKSFRFFVSLAVRISVVGRGIGSGSLESHYAQRAVEVRKGDIKTARDLAASMKSIMPLDKEFETSFANIIVSKSNVARYYLRTLELQMSNTSQPTHVPNSNEQMVNLEHILPQNPSTAWGYIDPETAKAYYNRLGNLTLLQQKVNSEIGNAGFKQKIKIYKNSTISLTSTIVTDYSEWGIDEIERRQAWMAKKAVIAWPMKI